MAEIEFYTDVNAVCCQKVELALVEKELQWSERRVSLARGEQLDGEYLKLNPNGLVPTVVHDGTAIYESTVICEYLDQVFCEPALRPSAAIEQARVRLWTKRVDEAIHEAGSVLSFAAAWGERFRCLPREERERRYSNVGDPIRRDMYRSTVEAGLGSPYVERAVILVERLFHDLEAELSDGRDWINSGSYTLSDLALTPYVARLGYLGVLDLWTGERPAVRRWWERIRARRSYAAAIVDKIPTRELEAMESSGRAVRPFIEKMLECPIVLN